jgi:hypothetical protein
MLRVNIQAPGKSVGSTNGDLRMRKWSVGWLLAFSAVTFGYQAGSRETASIEGRVIAQATGSPLKSAVVTLRQMPTSLSQRVNAKLVQQTNEEGRFLFTDIPAGAWELSADKRGFVTGKYGASKYDPQGSQITLGPNDQVKDLLLTLIPQAVVAGRVLDTEGRPVEGARVAILKVGYSNGVPHWSEAGSAVTLDNGEYRVPRVAAGRYLVKCGITEIDASGIKTTYAATYYPNAKELSMAAAVDVRSDGSEIGGIDISVAPTPVFHVRGRLQPSDGQQDLGRAVLVNKADQFSTFAERVIDRTDYLIDFDRVPPGSYVLYAWYGETVAAIPVEVKEHDIDNLLVNPAPGEIRGSLKLRPGGRQVDLRALSVTIQPLRPGRTIMHLPGPVRISNDLKYGYSVTWDEMAFEVKVSGVPEGCYIASVQYGGRDVPESGIEYVGGAALEITIGSDAASVDGKALDNDDHAREGAVVALIPADGRGATRSVRSGPQGSFRISGVPPGDYKLLAWDDVAQDDLDNPGFWQRFDSQATAVTLEPSGSASASIRVITQGTIH